MRKSNQGVFVLKHRVVLHAIDAMSTRWRGGEGLLPLELANTTALSGAPDSLVDFRTAQHVATRDIKDDLVAVDVDGGSEGLGVHALLDAQVLDRPRVEFC